MIKKCLHIPLFYLITLAVLTLNSTAYATINGVHGIKYSSSGDVSCKGDLVKVDSGSYFKGGACAISVTGYVPRSGQYKVKVEVTGPNYPAAYSTSAYFDATKNISAQNITVSGSNVNINFTSPYSVHTCYLLVDDQNREWAFDGGRGCSGYTPIPPTPPKPSCTLNNNSNLSVDLGTVDRALLPTYPDAAASKHMQIPVVCTNDNGTTVSVTMQLSYTPITVSGKEIVKSSTNGLGVAIFYNNQTLSPNESESLQLNTGSNNIDLAFQALRDPNVSVGNVPTGSFTASAILTMNVL